MSIDVTALGFCLDTLFACAGLAGLCPKSVPAVRTALLFAACDALATAAHRAGPLYIFWGALGVAAVVVGTYRERSSWPVTAAAVFSVDNLLAGGPALDATSAAVASFAMGLAGVAVAAAVLRLVPASRRRFAGAVLAALCAVALVCG
jgi:hypothetical protein